jgi:Trk-type K+ transport system membrane component
MNVKIEIGITTMRMEIKTKSSKWALKPMLIYPKIIKIKARKTDATIVNFLVLFLIFGTLIYHFGETVSNIIKKIVASTGIAR